MRKMHLVPLSNQLISVLKAQKFYLGKYHSVLPDLVFPGTQRASRGMSEGTVRSALHSLGFSSDVMTPHGFRGMASTILNESGLWSADAIERQLAHSPLDHTRETYNYAEYLPQRREMMQWYADELDRLRGEVEC